MLNAHASIGAGFQERRGLTGDRQLLVRGHYRDLDRCAVWRDHPRNLGSLGIEFRIHMESEAIETVHHRRSQGWAGLADPRCETEHIERQWGRLVPSPPPLFEFAKVIDPSQALEP